MSLKILINLNCKRAVLKPGQDNNRVTNSLVERTMQLTSKILNCEVEFFNKFIRNCQQKNVINTIASLTTKIGDFACDAQCK